MATLSSHLLNSVNGTHASNVDIIIYQIKSNGEKKVFYETKTDAGGRLLKEFNLNDEDCKSDYEMVCKTGDYFSEEKVNSLLNGFKNIALEKFEEGTFPRKLFFIVNEKK